MMLAKECIISVYKRNKKQTPKNRFTFLNSEFYSVTSKYIFVWDIDILSLLQIRQYWPFNVTEYNKRDSVYAASDVTVIQKIR